ncbi:MAG: hypothetical protein ACKV0T_00390 [Planctomycetales bacterium]
MTVYFVTDYFPPSAKVPKVRNQVFRGLIQRTGFTPVDTVMHANNPSPKNDFRVPLQVMRSGRCLPPAFAYNTDLIVSREVRDQMPRTANLEFLPVELLKLVDIAMPDPHRRLPPELAVACFDRTSPNNIFLNRPDVKALHRGAPEYWEVIMPTWREVKREFPKGRVRLKVAMEPDADIDDIIDVQLSVAMLETYPMIWWSGFIMREDFFAVLDSVLDREFFAVESRTI